MIDTTFRFCMHARAVLLAVALSSVLNAPVSAADPHETLYETQYQGLAMGTLITARLISPDDKAVQKLDDFLSDRIDAYETLFTVHRKKRLIGINAIRQEVIELLHRFVIRRNQTSGDQRSHRQPLVLRFVERFVRIGRRNGGIQHTGQSDS